LVAIGLSKIRLSIADFKSFNITTAGIAAFDAATKSQFRLTRHVSIAS
jgi:hypothetical protein